MKNHHLASPRWKCKILTILLLLPLIYGANLYFSLNKDINNPSIPIYWPVTKDIILGALIISVLYINKKTAFQAFKEPPITFLFLLAASASACAFFYFGFNQATVSFAKNAILYQFLGGIIGYVIAHHFSPHAIWRSLSIALYFTMAIGLLFLLHPVYSTDGRAYGTYGNPTSFGFSIVIILGLAFWRGSRFERALAGMACAIAYLFTGSLSVILATCFIIGLTCIYELVVHRRLRTAFITGLLFVSLILLATWVQHLLEQRIFIGSERLLEFFGDPNTIKTTDSVSVRWTALFTASPTLTYQRLDSYILSLWINFGFIPIAIYTIFIGSIIALYIKYGKGLEDSSLFYLLITLFFLNPILQHQLEIFPTNGLFAIILGIAVHHFKNSQKTLIKKLMNSPEKRRY